MTMVDDLAISKLSVHGLAPLAGNTSCQLKVLRAVKKVLLSSSYRDCENAVMGLPLVGI